MDREMIHFGTNPIAWANDDDRSLGADIPTARILAEAGPLIGFEGIENGHRWPEDPEALRDLLGGHGLRLISGWHSSALLTRSVEEEIAAARPHVAKLLHNGCRICIVCECSGAVHGRPDLPLSARPRLTPAEMQVFGAKIEQFALWLADQGLDLAYHPHMGTLVETPEEVEAFLEATGPATRLLFDTGHCTFGGGDPAQLLARHADRIVHVHAKNIREPVRRRALAENWSFLQAVRAGVFTVPGDPEGAIDFLPLIRQLRGAGYAGWLVIEAEQDPALRPPLHYQRLGLTTLRRLAKEAGYKP